MTAAELHAAVSQWPEEARAKDLTWVCGYPQVDFFTRGCEYDQGALCPDHAIALHVASGLEWLGGGCCHRTKCGWCWHEVHDMTNERAFTGPTLFHAIHAAILATKGNK